MTASIESKVSLLIESTLLDKISKIKEYFFGKYFKDFNETEFHLLLDIITKWYYFNTNISSFINSKKYKSIFDKIKLHIKLPKKLYRGLSIIRKHFEYESWSSSKLIAKSFTPGGKYSQDNKWGIIQEINPSDFKENIVFSLKSLIQNDEDKKNFYQKVLKEHIKELDGIPKKKNMVKYLKNNSIFSTMHGTIYALIEDEYILKTPEKNLNKIKITIIDG